MTCRISREKPSSSPAATVESVTRLRCSSREKTRTTILACRSLDKANAAATQIVASNPGATVEVMELDLSSLASIRSFADVFHKSHRSLDALVNNAGVMALPYRKTVDGFEMQFGTNHLGHFALTGLLLDTLLAADWRAGRQREQRRASDGPYPLRRSPMGTRLLQMVRLRAEQAGELAVHLRIATPRRSRRREVDRRRMSSRIRGDEPAGAGPRMRGSSGMESLWGTMNGMFAQSAAMGALPTLYAATSPEVRGGDYIGPDGIGEMWGHPVESEHAAAAAKDPAVASRLWEVSEQLTKVHYSFK